MSAPKMVSERPLFTLSVQGEPYRCACRANVFYKPEPRERPLVYACNACGQWYEGEHRSSRRDSGDTA